MTKSQLCMKPTIDKLHKNYIELAMPKIQIMNNFMKHSTFINSFFEISLTVPNWATVFLVHFQEW